MKLSRAVVIVSTCCLLAAAARADEAPLEGQVLVLSAASTTDAVDALRAAFVKTHPQVTVDAGFAASSALAQQIAAGAPADVYLSANERWADFLDEKGLVARRRDLLSNRLVVVVADDSKLEVKRPADLEQQGIDHVALADPTSVPAGIYARQALAELGLWQDLEAKVVSAADVRQAMQLVVSGAAEAAIVYASDAATSDRVRVAVELDESLSEPIRYPVVLLNRGAERPAAVAFYDYLLSAEAADVFRRYGFLVMADDHPAADAVPVAAAQRWWGLSRDEWLALRLSFQVGLCAVVASLPVAIAAGYVLARWQSRAKWVLELVVNLPLVLPPVVTGLLLLFVFSPKGPIGGALAGTLGIEIVFTWLGAAIASAVVSFPLMVRAIRLAFQAVDPRLEMVARSLGAGRADAFFSVTLPLARSGVLAGCVLAFARSLGEFGATIMVAGNIVGETQTIPLAIFSAGNRPGFEAEVWRLASISIVLAALALVASEWLERRHATREST
ncbi:MAG: molybdate ABC transporter permease [Planctomycetota bacterium]|nr:MAG: molybdate ABC transporter permease [Planctomycetota bacterium]